MNGIAMIEDGSEIDRRPIITSAGEIDVFSTFEDNLSESLPQDTCEWRRSLGRPVRSVHIGAVFVPYSPAALPKGNQWDLIRQALFHIYWTDCSDVDLYKSTVKEEIENWLKELTDKDISDWLIVVVENFDGKRANKLLPRTTVLDKIRADFAAKQGDRCISVINPGKTESRSTDSWRGLVSRIRHLLLVAYARAVYRLEDYVRQQRERRNELGWDFMQYFYLQEELAQVLEMLGLNDEALVQYDELDALFSQFVVNGITSESVNWLNNFQKSLQRWRGLKLGPSKMSNDPSILELRAYLFAKQAHMLLLTNRVWEMASRCLPFLHTCIKELVILDVNAPPGAVSCWLFLASMEVLQTCDKYNRADEVEEYSLHTASLWEYASQKLRSLGELCGLLPGGSPSSEQLHTVVGLSAGMGDNPGTPNNPSPTDKLKIALCSQDAFNKTYLELAELAMGTYKHIGRLRSARQVGREVASFYMLLGETQKAAAFLGDALRTFEQDGWHELAAQTQIELAECFKKAKDFKKLVCASACVSAALEVDTLIRWTYFDEMRKCLNCLSEPLVVPFSNIIKLVRVSVKNDGVIMQDNDINVELVIESNFPREFICTRLAVSLEVDGKDNKDQKKTGERICANRTLTGRDMKFQDPLLQRLKIKRYLEFKQDKQLATAGIASKFTELKRKDSSSVQQHHQQGDFSHCLEANSLPLVIAPGLNVIRLKKEAKHVGKYHLGQVAVHMENLQLISPPLIPKLSLEIKEEGPTLKLFKKAAPLISGFEQIMNLILTIGSYTIEPKSKIKLTASVGLMVQVESDLPLANTLEFEGSGRYALEGSSGDHPLSLEYQTYSGSSKLHAAPNGHLEVIHSGTKEVRPSEHNWTVRKDLIVYQAQLNVGDSCRAVMKNCDFSQVISDGLTYSYIWALVLEQNFESTIKAEFSIRYKLDEGDEDGKLYQYFFDIADYQTLYVLEASVEPAKESEFCRVGVVCHLHLSLENIGSSLRTNNIKSVMYEVLAEQNVWAVCGRTAGVVTFDTEEELQTVVLDVMPLTSGHLPLPLVRISKYIPAEIGISDKPYKGDTHPRLEPFSPGQVYNKSKGKQLHVIATVS